MGWLNWWDHVEGKSRRRGDFEGERRNATPTSSPQLSRIGTRTQPHHATLSLPASHTDCANRTNTTPNTTEPPRAYC